ncbi:uncharacterized protein [Panulirus ornatus]|uniref:uncharacterized protein n=1 Tax=Panulirus ornatus TaxID=150431 RepID=UPI003A892589
MLQCRVKKVLPLGLLLAAVMLVEGGPARERVPGTHTLKDNLSDVYDEVQDTGVLQRIWSGLRTGLGSLAGLGRNNIGERMASFQRESQERLYREMNSLLQVRHRQRRAHAQDATLTRDDTGYYTLLYPDDNVNPIFKAFAVPHHAISMVIFEHKDYIIWLVTESYTQSNPGRLHVYALQLDDHLQTTSVDTRGATKCVPVLLMDKFVEFVCVESQGERATDKTRIGSGVYRMTLDKGLSVSFHRALRTHGAQDVAVWTLGGQTYLAFANSYDIVRQTGEISSVVFKLQTMTLDGKVYSTYDKVDSATFGSRNGRGVEAFKIVSRQFVAVANHADDLGNVDIDSDIFVYDVDRAALKPFQRIRTSGARDWIAFSFISGPDAEYFLAVANEYSYDKDGNKNFEVDSVIYKYDNGKFVPFQCIPTFGAREWLVYQGPGGEFVLAVVNSQSGIFFYHYNGWRFILAPFKVSGAGVERAWISRLSNTLNEVVLAVVNPTEDATRPLVFYLKFEYMNPLAMYHNETLAWCKSFKGITDDGMSRLVANVRNSPKTDEDYISSLPMTITGNLLLPAGPYISEVRQIYVRDQDYKVDFSFNDYESSVKDVSKAFQRVTEAQTIVEHSKKVSDSDLDGLHFSNMKFHCQRSANMIIGGGCQVDEFFVERVNGISASFENVLRLDDKVELVNQSFADVDVSDGGRANIVFLSGPNFPQTPTRDLVTLTGDHQITGTKTFGLVRTNELKTSGSVDSVLVDEKNLLLTVKEQRITSNVTVASLTTNLIQTKNLYGRDFSVFHESLVLNHTNQYISGAIIVDGDLIAPSVRTSHPSVPLDPGTLVHRALFHNTKETQEITGVHTAEGLTLQRGLTVLGLVNGVSVPEHVYLKHRRETVGRLASFGNIAADTIAIERSLGSVKVIDGDLDLLRLKGNQEIVGEKSLHSMSIAGHSTVVYTVSGYKIDDLQNIMADDFVKKVNSGHKIFGSVKFSDALYVTNDYVNGVSISNIRNNAIHVDSKSISTKFIFEGNVEIVGDTTVALKLDGIKPEDFVLRSSPHVFARDVTFTTDVKVQGNVGVQTVNGIDFDRLLSLIVFKNKTHTISQDVYLYNPVMANLAVRGQVTIDDVHLDDVIIINSSAIITGGKTFTTVKVVSYASAREAGVAQFGTVDGVVLDDLFFANSLMKTGGSVQHLVGRSLNVVATTSITGTDFSAFERSIVYKDSATERIAGFVSFNGPVVVREFTFSNRFDGVSAEDYKLSWLKKTGSQTLIGVNKMANMEVIRVTFTGNLIQEVNLEHLFRNTAKIDEASSLQQMSFDELIASKDVVLDGSVQGWNLNEDAMKTNEVVQKVTGKKTFASLVHYYGQFPVVKYVLVKKYAHDETLAIDVGKLCLELGTLEPTIHLKYWTIGGDVDFRGNVTITGVINEDDVATLEDVFWLTDVPNDIAAVASFADVNHGVNVNLELDLLGSINGQDLENVWDQVLKKECRKQTVNGEYTLHKLIADVLLTDFLINRDDDAGVTDLVGILLKDGDQEIAGKLNIVKVETKADIILDGSLNGHKVESDFVQYGKTATISSRKSFLDNMRVQGDISLVDESTVQGVDLSELGRVSVRVTDDGRVYTIPGVTTFKGLKYSGLHFQVLGTVDGILLNKGNILLRSGYQEMLGTLVINPEVSGVVLQAAVVFVLDNHFNQMNLDRLRNLTVRTDRASVILEEVSFLDVCYFKTLTLGNNLINSYNINDLRRFINGNYLVTIGNYLSVALQAAQDTQDVLADKNEEIWYYEETPLENMYKILAVSLISNFLEPKVFDTLVGLDRKLDLVHTYSIATGFPRLYAAVSVMEPVAVAGLSSGLLATCGARVMTATPENVQHTPDFTLIPLEGSGGYNHSYGHIHSLEGQMGLEAAFGIEDCRDLVSFRLKDNRLCLAVLDYSASSTVVCGNVSSGFQLMNYLGTKRAVKGAWMNFRRETYLLVAEEESDFEPGYLKLFEHNDITDGMQLVRVLEVPGASHVDVIVKDSLAVVVTTSRANLLCNSTISVFHIRVGEYHIEIQDRQVIEVYEAFHSSLSLLPTKQIALFVQTRRTVQVYYIQDKEFVFTREVRTTPSLCPFSFPFLHGNPKTLMIPYAGLGWLDLHYPEENLELVPSTMYKAVYRTTSTVPLY